MTFLEVFDSAGPLLILAVVILVGVSFGALTRRIGLPGVTGQITRSSTITVEAIDLAGQPYRLVSDEFPACVWQHEMDHLNGVLIMDRMAPIDRMANRRTLQDLEKNYAPGTTPTVMRNL